MRLLTVAIFAVSLVTNCAAHAQLRVQEQRLTSMGQFVNDWCNALNQNDAEKQMSFYANTDVVQVITSDGVLLRGSTAIKEVYMKANRKVEFHDSRTSKQHGTLSGDNAIVTFEHRFNVRTIPDGQRFARLIRTVMFLTNHNGAWKISSEHSSPIHGVQATTKLETEKIDIP